MNLHHILKSVNPAIFANIGRTDTIGSGVRNLYKYTPIYSDGGKPELIEDDVFRITIPLDKMAADEAREQKTLSEREQKIYNMICENIHLSVEQVMAELDISRATVFRDYAKIKKVTGAMYDKDINMDFVTHLVSSSLKIVSPKSHEI